MRKEINITTYKQDKQRNCNLLRCKKIININTVDCFVGTTSPRTRTNPNIWKLDLFLQAKNGTNEKKNRKQLISISNPPGKEYPFVDKPFRMVKDVLLCSTVTLKITLTHQTMHHQLYLISTESNNNSLPFVSIAQL